MEGIEILLGKTVIEILSGEDHITFITSEGNIYRMVHHQDCCENVYIEDINGDLQDLVNSPITMAEEAVSTDLQPWESTEHQAESFTWTFYKLATVKGYVNIRWYGSSNGYYSEGVSFDEVTPIIYGKY